MGIRVSLLRMSMISLALGGVLTACGSNSAYTYNDAAPAISALSQSMATATTNGDVPADPAYTIVSGVDTTFVFTSYFNSPYTLNGSLTEVTASSTINGTINFTGGSVTQIVYTNVVESPPSGTYQITFSGQGLVYVHNLATQTFTLRGSNVMTSGKV